MTSGPDPATASRLHLDPVGGVAGDMFVAAVLDLQPEAESDAIEAARAIGLPQSVSLALRAHKDHALTGRRFVVANADDAPSHTASTPWRDIRKRLEEAALPGDTAARAIDIFARLATVEAAVHGVAIDEVTFHEVGAWDSIADIVAAAYLIDRVGHVRWTAPPLPLGAGRVKTAHGALPVPAPATAALLQGFMTIEDGIPGERITPTGAAILAHLAPEQEASQPPARLLATGTGFGSKTMPGISNVLRVLAFNEHGTGAYTAADEIAVLRFEVDDQSPEDLAVGLDRLRDRPGVLDVTQAPVFGKKGRIAAQVQVLAESGSREDTIAACLNETTTLGVRWELTRRATLPREVRKGGNAGGIRVKETRRPDGRTTAKAEMDDIGRAGDRAARSRARREAEGPAATNDDEDGSR